MHTALRRKDYYSMAKIRAAVLFGGVTKDHKISLVSAHSILTVFLPKNTILPLSVLRKREDGFISPGITLKLRTEPGRITATAVPLS